MTQQETAEPRPYPKTFTVAASVKVFCCTTVGTRKKAMKSHGKVLGIRFKVTFRRTVRIKIAFRLESVC